MGRKLESVLNGFTAQKCLTLLKLTSPRITISRNRRAIAVRQLRGQIAQLLKSGQATQVYNTKIDSLMRDENIVAAYDLLHHFCQSIISQFPIIETQRYCPPDLKEAIATLIYAAPRCAELAELNQVRDMLTAKYGKEFVIAAEEIRLESSVNAQIIELLSMHPASEQMKVKKMKEICVQHNIGWRPEWALGAALEMPRSDFSDASSWARVDMARGEGTIKLQPAEAASSSGRGPNLGQDMKSNPHRGSRQGEGTRANTRVSESMDAPYRASSLGFGSKSNPLSQKDVTRANVRDLESAHEPYGPAAPAFSQKDSSISSENITKASMRVSESLHEPHKPGYRAKHNSVPKEELPKASVKFFEGVDEPYRPSPGFGAQIPEEKVTRANTRISEDMKEPYAHEYSPKHSSLPRAKIKASDDPYPSGYGPKYRSIPREEVPKDKFPRANLSVSEDIYEPKKPSTASFGSSKAADYKQDVKEDRTEYRMQHPDEISDSGSDVFISVEEDEVVKHDISCTMTKDAFEGRTEDHFSGSSLTARSLRARRETCREAPSLKATRNTNSKESPYENSYRANNQIEEHYTHKNKRVEEKQSFKASKGTQTNDPNIEHIVPTVEKIVHHKSVSSSSDCFEEQDDFASTAKAIAVEAARLAILNYAKQYSWSGSTSTATGQLTEDALENMEKKAVYQKTNLGNYDDDGDQHMDSMGFARDSTKEKYNQPSKKAAEHDIDYEIHVEYERSETEQEAEQSSYTAAYNADVDPFAQKRGNNEVVNQAHKSLLSVKKEREELKRNTQRRHGEEPLSNTERHRDLVDVNTRFSEPSPHTYNYGKPRYDVQGKIVESPPLDQAIYSQQQFLEESSNPYNVGSMSEKRPVFDEELNCSPYQNKYNHEMSDQTYQHYSSSKFKEENPYKEHEPYIDRKAREEKLLYANQMNHDMGKRQMRELHGIHQQEYESETLIGAMSAIQAANSQAMHKSSSSSPRGAPFHEEDLHTKAQLRKTIVNPNAGKGQLMSDRTVKSPNQFAQQQMTQEDTDENEQYAKDRNWNAAPTHDRENSMRARTQTDRVVSSMSSRSSTRGSKKNIIDEVLSAKWHGDDVSMGTEGPSNTQNKSQEPAIRNKPLAQDSYMGKRTLLQQKPHESKPDLVSVYMPHGQADDLVKRISSNSTSGQQQGHCEDIQIAASSYTPSVQHNRRKITTLQKQGEEGSRSKYNDADQPNQQEKNQSKPEWPYNHKEHHNQGTTTMGPNHHYGPPTRKPPPLPQNNTAISNRNQDPESIWDNRHSLYQSQKKEEEQGAYERNDFAMLDRRPQQSTRPPPQVMASTPRVNDRERHCKLDKEGSWTPTRQPPPVKPTRQGSSPLETSTSNPVISAAKHSSSSSSSLSASSATSPSPAAPTVLPKLPHVDDIAANLEALKLARLRKP